MTKLVLMNADYREPRVGEGLVPLFAAAAVFWMIVAALSVWLL
jgi:hypothetical protein